MMTITRVGAFLVLTALLLGRAEAAQTTTLTISGQNGTVISGLKISTTSGPCIVIQGGSTNITVKNSDIGPCGTDASTAESQGIKIESSSQVHIYDNYIHVETKASAASDTHTNVRVRGSNNVDIKGNVIAYGESNVEVDAAVSTFVTVDGNFLLNPRGPYYHGQNVQIYGDSTHINNNITVSNNYTLSDSGHKFPAAQEDSLSFGFGGPVFNVTGNWVQGGESNSGAMITFDQGMLGGTISDNIGHPYNGGIQVVSGSAVTVSNNKVQITAGGVNGAAFIFAIFSGPDNCGTVTASNNIGTSPGGNGGLYTDAGCTVVQSGNTFDTSGTCRVGYGNTPPGSCLAWAALNPIEVTNPPPAIPPVPVNCVARSPYTTNTTRCLCAPAS